MTKVFGFVAEPHKSNYYVVTPAVKENGEVICCDCSWFLGSWKMRAGGVFFPTVSGDVFCREAMEAANLYAKEKNK
jgi:hypothetical protein